MECAHTTHMSVLLPKLEFEVFFDSTITIGQ